MSWQAYIDTSLLQAGTVSRAAIHGKDGNVWATSAGFSIAVAFGAILWNFLVVFLCCCFFKQITPQEAATVVGGFSDQGTFYANGIIVGHTKFKFLRTIEDSDGKISSVLGKEGDSSICVELCGSCIIVGISVSPTQPSAMVSTVGKLGDYLRQSGY